MTEFWSGWIDAHCHLASPEIPDLQQVLARARAQGLTGFVMGGVDPEDWERQRQLAVRDSSLWPVFGVHPYFVSEKSDDECETALDQLARLIPSTKSLIGEMGLDFRPKILASGNKDVAATETRTRQIHVFEAQLELAKVSDRPVCLHLVRAFDEAMQIFEMQGAPTRTGFVHAFTGSKPEAEAYLQFGFSLSIGGAICNAKNEKLRQAVEAMPLEKILVESDTPDQAPIDWPMVLNEPQSVLQVAEVIADLKKCTRDDILRASRANLRRILLSELS